VSVRFPSANAFSERSQPMTRCPECESDLELDGYDLDLGETVNCPECSVELRITSTEPIAVSVVKEDDE
jgi:lysine biosynthesis protein LysW